MKRAMKPCRAALALCAGWLAASMATLTAQAQPSTAVATPATTSGTSASAASAASAQVVQHIQARLQRSPVVTGRFEQLKTVQGFQRPLRSAGRFVVAQEQGIVWQVAQPFASTLVVKPESLQSRDGQGALQMQMQASDEPVLRTVNQMLFAVMSADLAQLHTWFEVTGQMQAQGWTLHLQPRDPLLAQWLQWMELQGDTQIHAVRLQEARGDRSDIRMQDVQGQQHLSAADAALFE